MTLVVTKGRGFLDLNPKERCRNLWTPEEDLILREVRDTGKVFDPIRLPRRTKKSAMKRARQLKMPLIKAHSRVSPLVPRIRKLVKQGLLREAIAREVGLTADQLRNTARWHGVRLPKPTPSINAHFRIVTTGFPILDALRKRTHECGMSVAQLSREVGMDPQLLVKPNGRHGKLTPDRLKRIVAILGGQITRGPDGGVLILWD